MEWSYTESDMSSLNEYRLKLINHVSDKLYADVFGSRSREHILGVIGSKTHTLQVVFVTIDQKEIKRYWCDAFFYLDILSYIKLDSVQFNVWTYKCLGKVQNSKFESLEVDVYEQIPSSVSVENIDIDELYRMYVDEEIEFEIVQLVEDMNQYA